MIRFECDYGEGAHPNILRALEKTNFEQTPGYGLDVHCKKATKEIREACKAPKAQVHFLVGGTQTNLIVVESILQPVQSVISPDSGHINTHEAGSIEGTGHKIVTIPSRDGKITAAQVQAFMEDHLHDGNREHVTQPGMVYISFPTETGTIYSKKELTQLSKVCKKYHLPLFVDGARMGYGIMAKGNDLTLTDFCKLTDVFYIGATKIGALFGEAVVITNPNLGKDFRTLMKRRGGMLAKGRMLGIQFEELFKNNLYFEISKNAIENAERLKKAMIKKGYSFYYEPQTNQLFPILPNTKITALRKDFAFHDWCKVDKSHTCVRFVTSWCTRKEDTDALIQAL